MFFQCEFQRLYYCSPRYNRLWVLRTAVCWVMTLVALAYRKSSQHRIPQFRCLCTCSLYQTETNTSPEMSKGVITYAGDTAFSLLMSTSEVNTKRTGTGLTAYLSLATVVHLLFLSIEQDWPCNYEAIWSGSILMGMLPRHPTHTTGFDTNVGRVF